MIIADTVNKQIYELIRSMILERKLKPGQRIDPKAIAEENNVSLMPVRNALQQLTAQGLVVTQQRVGIFVRKFTKDELLQISDARKMFELYCLDRYFDKINKQEALHLAQRVEKLESSQYKAMRIIDDNLHSMIIDASQNPFLTKQYSDMQSLFRLCIYTEEDDADSAKEEHLCLLDAICQGDRRRALRELERHLDRVAREIATDSFSHWDTLSK